MNNHSYKTGRRIWALSFFHILVTLGLFFVFWRVFRYGSLFGSNTDNTERYDLYVVILYGVLFSFFEHTYNAYLFGYTRIRELVFKQFITQLFSICIVYLVVALAWNKLHNPICFLEMLLCCIICDVVCSALGNRMYYESNPPKHSIILYRNDRDLQRLHGLTGKPMEKLYLFDKQLCTMGRDFISIKSELEPYDVIFAAGVDSTVRNGIMKYCAETGKSIISLPHIGDVLVKGSEHIPAFSSPVLAFSRKKLSIEYVFIKRAFDIFVSALGIIVLSPVMAIVALLIKIYDKGPALYKQTRLTQNGREFRILKFRSMREDAEKDGKARLSTGENDDRVTPIGRLIRKCRLDELPQLFNIFVGDMSIVGPRPERPEIAQEYYEQLPEFSLRLQVKAGLTGYAQVFGKYNTEPYEKLEFDLLYINSMSVLTDLKLMFATVGILFSKESTEGVKAGNTTAVDDGNHADSGENKAGTVA